MSEADKNPGPDIYTIQVPADADVFQKLAFTSLIHAFSWSYDKTTLDETEVTSSSIVEASERYYGSEVYGELANGILTQVRRAACGNIYRATSETASHLPQNGEYVVFAHSLLHLPNIPVPDRPRFDRVRAIRKRLSEGYREKRPISLPFDLAESMGDYHRSDFYGLRVGNLSPGDVARSQLGEFVTSIGWDKHEHKGSLGKAIDLLRSQAGLLDLREESTDDSELVDLDILYAEAREWGASKDIIRYLKDRINGNFLCAVFSRTPDTASELTFEGRVQLHGPSSVKLEKITRASLVLLAQQYKDTATIVPFLHQYAEAGQLGD